MNRQHIQRLPRNWWLRKRTYFAFMVRELTSVFVGGYAVFLLVMLWRADDASTFSSVFDALDGAWSLVIHVILLVVVLYHTVTWINLTPKVLVLFRDDEQISPALIAASGYVAWLVVSGLVAWVALR